MKYILAAMCGLAVLFMGGCAVVALAAGPLALLPGGIALLNLAILGALFGWKLQWKPAFYILGITDLVIAASSAFLAFSMSGGASVQGGGAALIWIVAGLFLAKAVLSFVYAREPSGA